MYTAAPCWVECDLFLSYYQTKNLFGSENRFNFKNEKETTYDTEYRVDNKSNCIIASFIYLFISSMAYFETITIAFNYKMSCTA